MSNHTKHKLQTSYFYENRLIKLNSGYVQLNIVTLLQISEYDRNAAGMQIGQAYRHI